MGDGYVPVSILTHIFLILGSNSCGLSTATIEY